MTEQMLLYNRITTVQFAAVCTHIETLRDGQSSRKVYIPKQRSLSQKE